MKYRPEYQLDRLRMMMAAAAEGEQAMMLHLRWLRTIVVDLSHTAKAYVDERLALQQRSAVGCAAVQRVVCKDLLGDHLCRLLPFLTHSVPMLTLLDLRGVRCDVGDAFFLAVADAHSSSLRRLYLPPYCSITQSTLDRFTQLEELDASGCQGLKNVDFCSATLRGLYANRCDNLMDAGLRRATRLEVLHVSGCSQVTDVSPFAHCLLELDASFHSWCGIGSAALSACRRLQVLNVYDNAIIRTLKPFARRLRELDAGRDSALNDAALANAKGLVRLSAREKQFKSLNRHISTVAPFGASLRWLDASYSNIGDAGLVTATNLVYVNVSRNSDQIYSLAPFAAALLELDASVSLINEAALSAATNLIWLNVSNNKTITTLQSCGRSLRHLVASYDCALTNEGLSTATQLVTLDCRWSPNLTTMEPFLHSLEELASYSRAMLRMVAHASQLRRVDGRFTWCRRAAGCVHCPPCCRELHSCNPTVGGGSYGVPLRSWRNAPSHRSGSGRDTTTTTTTNSSKKNRKRRRH